MPAPRICNYPKDALEQINRIIDGKSSGYRNFIARLCQEKKWDTEHAKGWPSLQQVDDYIGWYKDRKRVGKMTTGIMSMTEVDGLQNILDSAHDGKALSEKDLLKAKGSLVGKLKFWVERLEEQNINALDIDEVDLIRKFTKDILETLGAVNKDKNPNPSGTTININNYTPQLLAREIFGVFMSAIRKNFPKISFELERMLIEEMDRYVKGEPAEELKTIDVTDEGND